MGCACRNAAAWSRRPRCWSSRTRPPPKARPEMEYLDGLIVIVGLYVILAASFNLIIGYGGLVSIAHPVFFALGAYASAILSRDFAVPVPVAMLAGAAVALAASIALALPSLRVSGDYLLIASI